MTIMVEAILLQTPTEYYRAIITTQKPSEHFFLTIEKWEDDGILLDGEAYRKTHFDGEGFCRVWVMACRIGHDGVIEWHHTIPALLEPWNKACQEYVDRIMRMKAFL